MTFFLTIVFLIIFGLTLGILISFLLPISAIFGTLIGGEQYERNKYQFFLGSLVGILFQSYFYLCYVAFIISWTRNRINEKGTFDFIIWIFTFFVAILPIWLFLINLKTNRKTKQIEYHNIIITMTSISAYIAVIFYLIFIFSPNIMSSFWSWVPYV